MGRKIAVIALMAVYLIMGLYAMETDQLTFETPFYFLFIELVVGFLLVLRFSKKNLVLFVLTWVTFFTPFLIIYVEYFLPYPWFVVLVLIALWYIFIYKTNNLNESFLWTFVTSFSLLVGLYITSVAIVIIMFFTIGFSIP